MEEVIEISSKELASILKVDIATIAYHVAQGNLPQPLRGDKPRSQVLVFDKQQVLQALRLDSLDHEFLNLAEAGAVLGLTPEAVKSLCNHRYLPLPYYGFSYQNGSRYLFTREDLEKYKSHQQFFLIRSAHRPLEYKLKFLARVTEAGLKIAHLDERTTEFIRSYYLEGKSLDEVGVKYGYATESVRQIILEALQLLFKRLERYDEADAIINKQALKISELEAENAILRARLGEQAKQKKLASETVLIKDLEFSVRARNCLGHAGLITLNQTEEYRESEFLKFRNFGRKTLAEVREQMLRYNFEFKKE